MSGIAYKTRTKPVFLNFNDNGPGIILTAKRYSNEVLSPLAVPFLAEPQEYELQQDIAIPNTAIIFQDFL